MPASTATPAATPILKRKQSWFGSIIRNVVQHSTSTAKAAVENVRQRITATPTPLLVDDKAQSQTATPPRPRHRKTQSVRSTISSIRARLPRRSLESRHHSVSDFHAQDRTTTPPIPETLYISPKRKGLAIIAAHVPLPSSPIDVPVKAPSLSLDLGDCHLMTARSASSPPARAGKLHRLDDMVPDPLQPVAEARPALGRSLERTVLKPSWPLLESPLPGTNSTIELEQSRDKGNAVLVIGDLSRPSYKHASVQTTFVQQPKEGSRRSRSTINQIKCLEIVNSGPPSPDKMVRLSLRPKPSIDSVLQVRKTDSHAASLHQMYSKGTSLRSSQGSFQTPRSSPARYHKQSVPEMTVAVLRERTDDHLQHPERFAAVTNDRLQGINTSPISELSQSSRSCPSITASRQGTSAQFHATQPSTAAYGRGTRPSPVSDDNISPMQALADSSSEPHIDGFTHRRRMASSQSPLVQRLETAHSNSCVDDSDSEISWQEMSISYGRGYRF